MAKRKADVASLNLPEVLEPTSAAQLRKAKRPESLSAPKALTFANQLEASAIAQLAAGECGFDEGEMAAMLMMRPVMAATHVFDFIKSQAICRRRKNSTCCCSTLNSCLLLSVAMLQQCWASGLCAAWSRRGTRVRVIQSCVHCR